MKIRISLRINSCESIRAHCPDSRFEAPGHLRPQVAYRKVYAQLVYVVSPKEGKLEDADSRPDRGHVTREVQTVN